MLDDRPILKDRLQAFAVFSGIAIGAVSGFEMVIGGGFDPLTPGREPPRIERADFSPYMDIAAASYADGAHTIPVGYFDTTMSLASPNVSGDDLAGSDANWAPSSAGMRDEADVLADIERLMRETETGFGAGGEAAETAPVEDAPVTYEDAPITYEEEPRDSDPELNASEIATPS